MAACPATQLVAPPVITAGGALFAFPLSAAGWDVLWCAENSEGHRLKDRLQLGPFGDSWPCTPDIRKPLDLWDLGAFCGVAVGRLDLPTSRL